METKLNLAQRILQVYKTVKSIKKDDSVDTGSGKSYQAVTHDAVTRLLHDPITEAGIIIMPDMVEFSMVTSDVLKGSGNNQYTQRWYLATVKVSAEFINADDPKDFKIKSAYAYALDTSDKATNKAYSMALKAIYLKTFMLESMDDENAIPDVGGDQAQKGNRPPAAPRTNKPRPTPSGAVPATTPAANVSAQYMANNPPPSPKPNFAGKPPPQAPASLADRITPEPSREGDNDNNWANFDYGANVNKGTEG